MEYMLPTLLGLIVVGIILSLCIRSNHREKAEEFKKQVQKAKSDVERQKLEAKQKKELQTRAYDESRKAEFFKQLAEMDGQYAIKEKERKRLEEEETKRKAEEEKKKANQYVYLTDEQIRKLEEGIELPRLEECELMLQQGETVVFGSRATWQGRKSGEQYPGSVYVTVQRVGFFSEERGFALRHSEIVAVRIKEQCIMLHTEKGVYCLDLPRPDLMNIALNGLRNGLPIAGKNVAQSASYGNTGIDCVSKVDGMEGHEFETFCAKLLRKNGFDEVKVTKASGDQGVDILATKDGVKYAIQCKNYASRLGNTPIQEVNAGRIFYNCHVGAVMTNSTFTPAAEALAASTNVLLWDRKVLEQYIQRAD